MSRPEPILQVSGLRHAYGGRAALRGVDIAVAPGEIYGLLGPNGAGKTTLVRAVCGRLKPDAGEVRIAGRDPWRDGQARAALGLAPQALALYGHLTVAENLEAFAALAGVERGSVMGAVKYAMAVTETDAQAGRLVGQLSGGFQRRVNIAAAVLHRPRLLVLDEPTVGVDLTARAAIDECLRALRRDDVAILLVTHDLDQAGEIADRVGFLRDGSKMLEGEPKALIAEAFGSAMEVEVEVAGELEPPQQTLLTAAGLEQRGEAAWARVAADGYALAGRLDAQLKTAGVAVREIRVRRPTLRSLFTRVAETREAA